MKKKDVCAIIVCYYPDRHKLLQQFRAIQKQVRNILYVINEGAGAAEEFISLVCQKLHYVQKIDNDKNQGVAFAINQGIAHAKIIGSKYVLLLDQDSIPYVDMVEKLLEAESEEKKYNKKIAAVGPVFVDARTNDFSYFVRIGNFKLKKIYCKNYKKGIDTKISVDFLITSGTIYELKNLIKIGGMDSNLFIDHVDTEWFLRAKKMGYSSYGICNAYMEHTLGEKTRKIWMGKWIRIAHHSPLRHYYLFRNSILLLRRMYIPIRWKICELRRLLFIFVYFSLFSKRKNKNIICMISGILDGLKTVKENRLNLLEK